MRLVVLAAIIDLVAWIVPGIHVHGGFLWCTLVGRDLLGCRSLGPLFRLLTLPLIVLTLGLFLLAVNAVFSESPLRCRRILTVDNLVQLLIAVFSWIAEMILPLRGKKQRAGSISPVIRPRPL